MAEVDVSADVMSLIYTLFDENRAIVFLLGSRGETRYCECSPLFWHLGLEHMLLVCQISDPLRIPRPAPSRLILGKISYSSYGFFMFSRRGWANFPETIFRSKSRPP